MSSEAPGPQNNSSFSQGRKILRDNANRKLDSTNQKSRLIQNIVSVRYAALSPRAAEIQANRDYNNAIAAISERLQSENPDLDAAQIATLAEQELLSNANSLKALVGSGAIAAASRAKKTIDKAKKIKKAATAARALKLSNPIGWIWLALEFLIFTKTGRKVFLVLSLCLCCCCILVLGSLSSMLQFRVENLGDAIKNSSTLIYCAGGQDLVEQTTCMFEQKSEEYLQDVYTDEEQN